MKALAYLLTALAVIGLGFWAYKENYATQQALKDVARLNAEIADLREALSIQRAEWAYLNRPDRLRELATINFDRLGLLPLEPAQFGQVSHVAYPPPDLPDLGPLQGPVDVIGDQEQQP
ncbi:cell division protein FtsL [Gemmobacter denitrificans]|uniref:Cell division protein FtsL n=1 Tax=Gemmobacter denitrificans TaxID=3123040 RepID=A0ABU8BR58_9RHOB